MLLNYKPCKKQRIKETAVPNMPSCKISLWKNFIEKGKKFFVPTTFSLQHFQFGHDGWKTFFMEVS